MNKAIVLDKRAKKELDKFPRIVFLTQKTPLAEIEKAKKRLFELK